MIHGRIVVDGTELTVRGEGRVKFKSLARNAETGAVWIDVINGRGHWRSFDIGRVSTVHRTVKGRQ